MRSTEQTINARITTHDPSHILITHQVPCNDGQREGGHALPHLDAGRQPPEGLSSKQLSSKQLSEQQEATRSRKRISPGQWADLGRPAQGGDGQGVRGPRRALARPAAHALGA